MSRFITLLFMLLVFGLTGPLTGSGSAAAADAGTLDRLFAELKAAPDETAARRLAQEIWKVWTNPADKMLAELMKKALKARQDYDFDRARKILQQITAGWPDYAEGWNQRATVHFLIEDYENSLVYIAETLKREPRHFGSMAGRAVIRLRQGKAALGFQSIKAAMVYHPYLRERSFFPQFED